MNLVVDDYLIEFRKERDFSKLQEHGLSLRRSVKPSHEHHIISWAERVSGISHSCLETGFFSRALHIDTIGLYHECSLNFPDGIRAVESYSAPKSWRELKIEPKFGQPQSNPGEWNGVVIALQYAKDRSILRAGGEERYYQFLEEACAYYGKRAFLKIHPVTIGDPESRKRIEAMALKHGCEMGHVSTSIIDKAEAVVTFNSTFAVDALMRGKHVMQHAPGYFWQTGAVQYCSWKLTHDYKLCDPAYVDKFIDFLVWRYCWDERMPMADIATVMRCYEGNKELFPLPQELSYGGFHNR